MEYRKMNDLGVSPSLLGFGCMRFPTLENGQINEEEAEKMLDLAIRKGVTYIDTAYPYHEGNSEPFVGKVLKKYDRDKFFLATKLPIWKLEKPEDADEIFESQLKRLQVDRIDFYLLHALDKEKWETVKAFNILDILEKKRSEGKIRFIGFSFHDNYEVFEEIATYRAWDFCQIQYNFMDRNIQAGDKGVSLCEKLGIPLVIMEPIKGGALSRLPQDVVENLNKRAPHASLASWALRFVAAHEGVKVILSGMSSMEHVEDNLNTFNNYVPFEEEDFRLIDEVVSAVRARQKNGCTGCEYCMPCPFGVNIPGNFRMWNKISMYGIDQKEAIKMMEQLNEQERADQCRKCGKCEAMCPQHLSIREDLSKIVQEYWK